MKSILCYLIQLLFAASLGAQRFRCDYTYFKEADGFLKFQEIPANWHEARLRCTFEGSKLASPLTPGLRDAMMNLTKLNNVDCAIFTGIHAIRSRGDFFSVEGVHLSKIPHAWTSGEPDNAGDQEACLILVEDGKMADTKCTDTFPYICFKKDSEKMAMNACGTTDKGYYYEPRTKSCYKFHRNPRTWSRAHMACTAEGGHLVVVNSDLEAQVIKELYAKNPDNNKVANSWKPSAFVGFYDWNEHGDWLTVHGETLEAAGYSKFSLGEPNNGTWNSGGQYCGAIWRNGLFDDMWCEQLASFICEKSPDSLLCDAKNEK